MARTSRAERDRRCESALALVSQGKGFSDVVTRTATSLCLRTTLPNLVKLWPLVSSGSTRQKPLRRDAGSGSLPSIPSEGNWMKP